MLSAFELDFFADGQRRRTALGAGWNVRFEDVPPVRGFRWSKGDRSFPGWYYAVTTGGHVGYESWLERGRLILLDFAPDVVGIASQPFRLHWREGEEKRRHAPDYFVRLADGRARVVDVPCRGRCRRADRGGVRRVRAGLFGGGFGVCARRGPGSGVHGESAVAGPLPARAVRP
ncbi:TnsA-like heteromeric transposase endonuclease subunit [Streptomyces sp. NPDC094048]|uniref:TnsA-like heteromeric transposase endonuclease subunit n=1 Tax=Streptomyces sp. NPDC094048 TaxID=3155207 RepID=UPI00333032F8